MPAISLNLGDVDFLSDFNGLTNVADAVGWVVAGGKVAHSDEAGLEGISIAEVKVQMCKRIKHIKLSQRGIVGQIPVTLAKVADLRTFLEREKKMERTES